jgi:hypothetical protein
MKVGLQNVETSLQTEMERADDLERQLLSSQSEVNDTLGKISQYQIKERELTEKSRDLVSFI